MSNPPLCPICRREHYRGEPHGYNSAKGEYPGWDEPGVSDPTGGSPDRAPEPDGRGRRADQALRNKEWRAEHREAYRTYMRVYMRAYRAKYGRRRYPRPDAGDRPGVNSQ